MDVVKKRIGLWPLLHQVFTFDEAKDAFDHMIAKRHAGKVITKVSRVGANADVSQCSSERRAIRGEQSRGACLNDAFASLEQHRLRQSIESQYADSRSTRKHRGGNDVISGHQRE